MTWTAADVPDQAGRAFVVTGANSGLGFQTALELARRRATVVLAVRSVDRGAMAEQRIRYEVPDARTTVRELDLADLDSVETFADQTEGVDVLVNNAGVMALPRRETKQGYELQLGTNHLGHFALTGRLLGKLLAGDRPRVVTLSSNAHKTGRMNFDDLQGERRYFRWAAYGQAKLANLLFALELQRRADAHGAPLLSVAAHPGYAATNLQYQANNITGLPVDKLVNRAANTLIAQSGAMGALPTLYAATQDLPGGSYVGPDGPGEFRGHPRMVSPTSRARDEDTARRLWEVSEDLTGVRYDWQAAKAPA